MVTVITTKAFMRCVHANILALPLGLRPLGMLSERWLAHAHGKTQDINVKYKCLAVGGARSAIQGSGPPPGAAQASKAMLKRLRIRALLQATTCNLQVAELQESLCWATRYAALRHQSCTRSGTGGGKGAGRPKCPREWWENWGNAVT